MNLKYTATITDEMKLELFKRCFFYSPCITIEKSFIEAVRQTEEIWGKLINGTEENNNVGRTQKILLLATDGENCGKAGVITIIEQIRTNDKHYFYVTLTTYSKKSIIGVGEILDNYDFTQGIQPILKLFKKPLKTSLNINFNKNLFEDFENWEKILTNEGYQLFYI